MKQESPISLQGTTLKIGPWQAPAPETIQDLLIFYQVTKTEKATYEATLILKFQHETMPPEGVQPYVNPFPIEFHKNLQTFLREFEATKQDKAPYKLEYDMATLAQEERLFAATRQAFWNTHFQELINPLLEIQTQGKIGRIWLCVSSPEAFVRNLPWELMLKPYMVTPNLPQQIPNLTIVRTTCANLQDFELQPVPKAEGQLKLLFVTSLPERLEEHQKFLEIEYEQKRLIESLSEQDQGIVEIDFAEIASLEEIDALLTEGKHHILHISGHGDFKQPILSPEQAAAAPSNLPETKGLLVLEDEDGNRVDTSGQELGAVLKKHDSLQLVVLSNCNSGKAGERGLVEEVAAQGIPAVIGMRFIVTDHAAMEFTTVLYAGLASGKTLAEAFRNGQDALYWNPSAEGKRYEDTEWFTPILYSRKVVGVLVDVELAKTASSERLAAKLKSQADHLDSNFIGRRRYLAKIKRILEGPGHLSLHGMKGIGKSALALVAARNYAGENVVVVSEPKDMQYYFEQGQKAVVIVEVLDHHNAGYWRMVGGLLDMEFGPKVIVVSYHGIKFFGDQIEAMAVWKLSYAEQWRFVERSAAFGRWRPQDERPSLEDLGEIFDALDGHAGAIRLLEKAMAGYHGNDFADEIARQLPYILEEVQSQLTFDEIMEEVENLVLTASVFFDASPMAALIAVTGKSEEFLREYLTYAQLWGWCFFDGEVFEVHEVVRSWICNEGFLDEEEWRNVALRAGRYFVRLNLRIEAAIWYFEMAEAWEEFALASFRLEEEYRLVGHYSKASLLCSSLLDKDIGVRIRAEAMIKWGLNEDAQGNYETALKLYGQCLEIYREIGDKAELAATLNNTAQTFKAKGDFQACIMQEMESLEISRTLQNRDLEGIVLRNLGQTYNALGQYDTALQYLELSLDIRKESKSFEVENTTSSEIGLAAYFKGDYDRALAYFEESLKIARQIRDCKGEGVMLNNISMVRKARGDYDLALLCLEQSLVIRQEIGDFAGEGAVLNNIGTLYEALKNNQTSLRYLERSLKIRRQIGDLVGEAATLNNLGTNNYALGKFETAINYLEQCMVIQHKIGDKRGEAAASLNLGRIHIEMKQYEKALLNLNHGLRIHREIEGLVGEAHTLHNIGVLYYLQNEMENAILYLMKSFVIFRRLGFPEQNSTALYVFNIINEIGEHRFQEIFQFHKAQNPELDY